MQPATAQDGLQGEELFAQVLQEASPQEQGDEQACKVDLHCHTDQFCQRPCIDVRPAQCLRKAASGKAASSALEKGYARPSNILGRAVNIA